MTDIRGWVAKKSRGSASEGSMVAVKASRRGELVVIDFFTQMALEGRAYQVRAGTITTPLVGDLLVTDSAAEMCVDAAAGVTVIPVYLNLAIRLLTGILHEYAAKSVASASTAGTAVVPLNLMLGGTAALSTARVGAAGAVSVAAEATTTTRRDRAYSNPLAVAAGHDITTHEWAPINPPTLVGTACFYVQIAASGTGPSHYTVTDYIELTTTAVS